MIYYVILFLIIFLNYCIKDKKTYCWIVGAILVLFAGLRANIVGPDTTQYEYLFNETQKYGLDQLSFFFIDESQEAEPGYLLFQYWVGLIGNYNLFKFLCAIIQTVPAVYLIYRYSTNKCISLLVYFCLPVYTMMSMSMMRQGIAFGIFLIGFHFIVERKFKLYLLAIAIAFLFHSSVIATLPLYFLYNLPYRRKYNVMIIGVIVLSFVFSSVLFAYLTSFSRMQYEAGDAGGVKMLIFLLVLLGCSILVKEQKLKSPFLKFQLYLLVFTIVCWSVGMNLAAVFRLAAYTEFFLCLYIPNLLGATSNKNFRQLVVAVSCIVCVLVMQTIVLREREFFGYAPYYFLWEK